MIALIQVTAHLDYRPLLHLPGAGTELTGRVAYQSDSVLHRYRGAMKSV